MVVIVPPTKSERVGLFLDLKATTAIEPIEDPPMNTVDATIGDSTVFRDHPVDVLLAQGIIAAGPSPSSNTFRRVVVSLQY